MIVVDSSVVVDALVGHPANPHALALLADAEMHAPTLLDCEVASALRGHALAGRLPPGRLEEALDDFIGLTIHRHALTQALAAVLQLRENFTAYDAAYLVLASALEAPLHTADAKLLEGTRLGIDVRLVQAP